MPVVMSKENLMRDLFAVVVEHEVNPDDDWVSQELARLKLEGLERFPKATETIVAIAGMYAAKQLLKGGKVNAQSQVLAQSSL